MVRLLDENEIFDVEFKTLDNEIESCPPANRTLAWVRINIVEMKDTSRLQVQVGQFLEISSRMGHPMGFEQEGVKTALLDPKSRVFSYHGKENKSVPLN